MNLEKLKGWLRRIATAEGQKKAAAPDADDRPLRGEADRSHPGRPAPDRHQEPSKGPRPPAARVRARRVTRQGIPILNPDEDLARHFMTPTDVRDEALPGNASGRDAPDGKGRPGPVARRNATKRPKSVPHRNRAGIRQLDGQRDLSDYFLPSASEEGTSAQQPAVKTEDRAPTKAGRRPRVSADTDRHGIPRLDDRIDLGRFFEAALEEDDDTATEGELGEVFRASLDQDARRLMKEKSDGFFAPRRLSLKEKLRRYPVPQAQLDLHGDTALIAQQRTDNFLRTAGAAGTLTVRIIVGKGLHSEDGAVLPDVVEDLLVGLKRDGRVLTFRWDKGLKRKSGAVIVYLEPPC